MFLFAYFVVLQLLTEISKHSKWEYDTKATCEETNLPSDYQFC